MSMFQAMAGLGLLTMFGIMAWMIAHARTETLYRPMALIAFFAGFPAIWMAMSVTTGTPRPTMFYNVPESGIIIGYKPDTGKSLYLLLDMADGGAPVYYRTPWNSEKAEEIDKALKEGKGTAKLKFSTKKHMRWGKYDFDWPWDIPEAEVYIEPTERKMPDKTPMDPMAGMRLAPANGNDPD